MKRFEIPDRTTLVAVASIFLGFAVSSAIYPIGNADHRRGWDADAVDHTGPRDLRPPPYDPSTERLSHSVASRPHGNHPDLRGGPVRSMRPGDPLPLRWTREQLENREHSLLPVLRTLLLEDTDPRVRAEAAFSLRRLRDREAVPALTTALLEDPAAGVRVQAAGALAVVGEERATGALIEAALTDDDAAVRGEAVSAVGMLRLAAGVVPLAVVLDRDGEDDVRRRAAVALGQIRHRSALAALHSAMLDDASGDVRREATRSWTAIQRHIGWRP